MTKRSGYPWWSNLIGYVFWAAVFVTDRMPYWLPILAAILGIALGVYWASNLVIVR